MGARVVTAAALRSASGTPGRAACLAGSAPSFKGTAAALAAVERGGSGRATFSGPLVTDENVRVCGEYNAERLTGSTSVVQSWQAGRQRQLLLGYVHSRSCGRNWAAPHHRQALGAP